ncbi:glucose PTS transporter subunit IIA [Kineothrix sp. MSJ-39]|uniref:PTS transporter subunit IIABC n=1 Tax=Kineothrix sp. MSJ-39 TaxID=2841533 RepID=UPI001C11812D|nr:PTS transporter subunit IIABC [Kineothrix sp. MSJ-39]MBU5429141.1 glucose PTS transporter subunit IIA [Kineothrix sp. MSJ-39]
MKDKIFGVLQRVGRSFMLPIAILPVAGLLLGIGSSFTNATTIETYHLTGILGEGTIAHALLMIMNRVGSAVFDNLPLLFAIGVAIGMAKKEKEVAALSAVIAYLVMHTSIYAMLLLYGEITEDGQIADFVLEGSITSVCGIPSLQIGVFGGIIVGLGVAALHNRFYRIELPSALSFFGGTRFVPIISTVVYLFVGILLYYIWPTVQNGIYALGGFVTGSGYFGTLLFGLVKRALIPFGLHHVFYMPFWQTAVGGTKEVAGQLVQGGQNIFFAELADSANIAHFSADATRYFSGEFIFMIFGLPGAALAMYQCAKPEKKKATGGLLLSAALASMMTGITEPLEFSFLFVAPALFVVQVILAGSAYMIAHMLNVAVGLTFSGGLLDFFLFGILQGNEKTSWLRVIPVGIVYFFLYYVIFRFLIRKFDFKTPGREDEDGEIKLYTKADVNARKNAGAGGTGAGAGGIASADRSGVNPENEADRRSAAITRGLGGKDNISDVDCCATRLRCSVNDPSMVDDKVLKATGASGVVHRGNGVQIIYGPRVTVIKSDLEDYLSRAVPEIIIYSPITGQAADITAAPDEAFAQKMMGDGAVVMPKEPYVYAPTDGTVTFVFDTKHAIGFETDSGISLLIHVGIETVKLEGAGFTVVVENGQRVKAGDLLMELDLAWLKEHAPSIVTPVVCTELAENQHICMLTQASVKAGDPLFAVETK